MYSYVTLVEALNDLKKRGYSHNFNILDSSIYCKELQQSFEVEDFEVDEFYRFEGESNPSDLSELYALTTSSGVKGVLTDGVGISSDLPPEMLQKLKRIL